MRCVSLALFVYVQYVVCCQSDVFDCVGEFIVIGTADSDVVVGPAQHVVRSGR